VEDEEIAACVAGAVGSSPDGAQLEVLGGKQGLIVSRVTLLSGGSFVFKAVRESARRELALTEALARIAPAVSPRVIAFKEDAERRLYWLVMEDVGPRRLSDAPAVEGYIAAAHALASLQQASMEALPKLSDLGVPEVSQQTWEEIALRVLDRGTESGSAVVRSEFTRLEQAVWDVPDIAGDTIANPPALVHGDLHAGNIVLTADDPSVRILDWGSAYIGAAFLALEELLWPAARHVRPADLSPARAAYLRVWEPLLGKPGRLERAVEACRTLVRLELVDEYLRRPEQYDEYVVAAGMRKLTEAWHSWKVL
jgi:aminoglycoside phosphotransferase (APT) family kinase protein